MKRRDWLHRFLVALASCWSMVFLAFAPAGDPGPDVIEFNRHIRPILSDNCFPCHGPDKTKRQAKLRFDTEEGAFVDLGGYRAIVPGKLEESEMYRRVTAELEGERMPPVTSGRKLTAQQTGLIRRWIEQGAQWQKQWSLIPPRRLALPKITNTNWPRNAIDHFILERLEREGLSTSPETDPTTLIRRLTLDLTGLPPTPMEVDAFLADTSPKAYEKLVDRLLASPRYGERMAVPWLEAARYADTNGYQTDAERQMWRWRDWVIQAFNQNMPFDQFTIEQIAGDMLPNATLDQKIATGFNRNHRGNGEGGIIPEEYAVEYVVDRVDTTSTVWMGLTMGCARCHDHKYDPVTQKEFYQLFAFFNNVPEKGRAFKYGNSPPAIKAPTPQEQFELKKLDEKIAAAEGHFMSLRPRLAAAQAKWEKSLDLSKRIEWSIRRGLIAHYTLDGDIAADGNDSKAGALSNGKFQDGEAVFVRGRLAQAANFDGQRFIDGGDLANFGLNDKFSLGAWIYPSSPQAGAILSRMTRIAEVEGYSLSLEHGKVQLNLSKRWLDDALRVETETTFPSNRWYHVMVTYDGSKLAGGVKIYINGTAVKLRILLDELNQSFATKEPFRIGSFGSPEGRFHGDIDDVRVYSVALEPDEIEIVATADSIPEIAAIPPEQRSQAQANKIQAYFRAERAPNSIRRAWQELIAFRSLRQQLADRISTVMVMKEMERPRDTFTLIRGAYDQPGEKVAPNVPACFPPLPKSEKNDRLAFARWLVDPSNPLTPRVAVNRYWQMYFGTGLVKTVEDFGSQGELPSHPDLLDWLATDFVRTGWDIKALQKTIVMSATYRQSSKVRLELLQKDPENRLLHRGPRLRLRAEMIRDQALAVSGLLREKIGGPSVRPYQPAGLWQELTVDGTDYKPDRGENLYRRSLYTFWKRTIPPPSMTTFDAAVREICIVRETRTNTPLQALSLMNEVTYVEAARALAQRIMREGGRRPADRVTLAFRLATARRPTPAELLILLEGFKHHLAEYRKDEQAGLKLVKVGESIPDAKLDVCELAAYTSVASLILNLDETITKE